MMKKYISNYKKFISDTITPVSVYLRIRDQFPQSLLLESSEYNSNQNSFTFIAIQPRTTISVKNGYIKVDNKTKKIEDKTKDVKEALKSFMSNISVQQDDLTLQFNGLFGFTSFEAVQYFDTLDFSQNEKLDDIPLLHYGFYKYIIAINHFKDELIIVENLKEEEETNINYISDLIFSHRLPTYNFKKKNIEKSFVDDGDFLKAVIKGKEYCQKGDVFQIVFSKRFEQKFDGDEFNVYRALRSVNPSPYLFYFDYGNFKLMGSSPEAQLIITRGKATLNPIAGTYRKTGIEEKDAILAEKLSIDPKENAEHTMLVDLARNDLSRFCTNVKVTKYKEIQHFSHVLHIVSEVSGKVNNKLDAIDIFGATFPAGTLCGAPKYRALELIHENEKFQRSFYGGTVGILSLTGDINTAITIRSILSQNGKLHYQAGAGIVVDSVPEKELKEVDNKLAAIRMAIQNAENL